MPNTSKLIKMKVCNLGCVGAEGLTIELDEIVCLVGPNNAGKSTVLRAYEAAVNGLKLNEKEFNASTKKPATVELWIHVPEGAENIDAKWKEKDGELLLVRSLWTWEAPNTTPIRKTYDPEISDYAEDGKAAGLDNVFKSRLPKPFRIGSLENPAEEHKNLLKLVLEPVVAEINVAMKKEGSPLQQKIAELKAEANLPLAPFKVKIEALSKKLNTSYQRVFGSTKVSLELSLGDLGLDIPGALEKASTVEFVEPDGKLHWSCQGTGSQRALFWSMLEIRSDLKRLADHKTKSEKEIKDLKKTLEATKKKLATAKPDKKPTLEAEILSLEKEIDGKGKDLEKDAPPADGFLPGHMLLIDEPETALHPSAIRGARDHLYSLAAESGWQVMLTTHHPAFVDPTKDHTTIVRLHRSGNSFSPKVYRSDSANFSPDEKKELKSLLAFDLSIAEIFFGATVIVVEGDTEFASFTVTMDDDLVTYPVQSRPLVVRARGKATIPLVLNMLSHFKMDFAVLHDIDPPFAKGKTNPAYTVNANIAAAVENARKAGAKVIHRCSCPGFERHHGMKLPKKDKPLSAWRSVRDNPTIRASVKAVFDDLRRSADTIGEVTDGASYDAMLKKWIVDTSETDPAYLGGLEKQNT